MHSLYDVQTQVGELPLVLPSSRLSTKDFVILTDCSVCGLPGMNASWIWEKNWLLDSYRIIQNRSAQMELQRTLICESCYTDAMDDGGFQTAEGWWMFENEYKKTQMKDTSVTVTLQRQGPEDYQQGDRPMGEVCMVIEGSSQQHAETSEQAGFSENQQIEEDLGKVGLLTADASKEWCEGVIASAQLNQFRWCTIVARSLETFQEEEEKRAAAEAKFAAQFENDFECATHQSESEGKQDKMEQAAEEKASTAPRF